MFMSTHRKQPVTASKLPTFRKIDDNIRTLTAELEQEKTLLPETQSGRLERLLRIYAALEPLLTALTLLPLIPARWRDTLRLFLNTLEALAGSGIPEVPTVEFKAGRDL
jgi:hypothetical protein